MRNILIPTDFSENSLEAAFFAAKIFSKHSLHFVILYSFEEEMSGLTSRVDLGKSEQVFNSLYENADKEGHQFISQLKNKLEENKFTYHFIATGMALPRAINSLVKKEQIDLTVMGTKGKTADENIIMGSTTAAIIKKIKGSPLLVVPHLKENKKIIKIGFATDFMDNFNENMFTPLKHFIDATNAQLDIVTVSTPGKDDFINKHKKEYVAYFENTTAIFHEIKKSISISNSLKEFAIKQKIDLYTLIYRKHNPILKLFKEPIISKVGKSINIPYLLIPKS